jgi:Holliday junction DNA helicase RuvA
MILSTFSSDEFNQAILSEDVNRLKSVKGLGVKSAQRLILELKDKFKLDAQQEIKSGKVSAQTYSSGNVPKAVEALSVLGYSAADVSPFISTLDPSLPVEQLIGETLKLMGR